MNELDVLSEVRAGVAPMSERARLAGKARLTTTMAAADPTADSAARPAPGLRPVPRRRLVTGLATGLALAAAATGVLVLGAPADQRPAAAADVLNRAADAMEADPGPPPRPDQYFFQEERGGPSLFGVDRPDLRSWGHVWSWQAVDGTRPGLVRETLENTTCPPQPTGSVVVQASPTGGEVAAADLCRDGQQRTPVYDPKNGLLLAPYAVLAGLPTDPATILAVLGADRSAISPPGVSVPQPDRKAQTWALISSVIGRMPPAQRAALFRAMAQLQGTVLYPHTKDAAGRDGIGIGLDDPRLGAVVSKVVLIFDRATSHYLGYNIVNKRGIAEFSTAVLRTGFVDKVGQIPS